MYLVIWKDTDESGWSGCTYYRATDSLPAAHLWLQAQFADMCAERGAMRPPSDPRWWAPAVGTEVHLPRIYNCDGPTHYASVSVSILKELKSGVWEFNGCDLD